MNRNVFNKINQLLDLFPVVAIVGVRQCGKTTLAKQLRPHWLYIDMEKPSDYHRVEGDPEFFFKQHASHVIIDEAQLSSTVFNVLRGIVDADRKSAGRFLLTGSSSPQRMTHISERLAGRVAIVELGTFKANELAAKPLSQIYSLLQAPLLLSDPWRE